MDIDLLSKMVKELILDKDEVSLPGVGTFVAEMVPSSFADRGYTILPPYRRLFFRQRVDDADTALVDFYANSNGIEKERAQRIVTDFLLEMRDVLKQKKSIVFPGLGKLRATRENHFFFVADEDLDIYPAGFGLEPISLKTHQETPEEVSSVVEQLRAILTEKNTAPAVEPVLDEPVAEVAEEPVIEGTAIPVEQAPVIEEEPAPIVPVAEETPAVPVAEEPVVPVEPVVEEETPAVPVTEEPVAPVKEEPAAPIAEELVVPAEEPAAETVAPVVEEPVNSPEAPVKEEPAAPIAEELVSTPEVPVKAQEVSVKVAEAPVKAQEVPAAKPEAPAEEPVRRRPAWKIWLWIGLGLLGLVILALVIFVILAHVAPDFIDSLLYTPEELEILHYPG